MGAHQSSGWGGFQKEEIAEEREDRWVGGGQRKSGGLGRSPSGRGNKMYRSLEGRE